MARSILGQRRSTDARLQKIDGFLMSALTVIVAIECLHA
jgi:hypothetical protein